MGVQLIKKIAFLPFLLFFNYEHFMVYNLVKMFVHEDRIKVKIKNTGLT